MKTEGGLEFLKHKEGFEDRWNFRSPEAIASVEKNVGITLWNAIQENDLKRAEEVLMGPHHDFLLNMSSLSGWTTLHQCVHYAKNNTLLDLLLKQGVKVNAKDRDGSTPLHLAARYGDIEQMKALTLAGAEINEKDHDGVTPLYKSILFLQWDATWNLLQWGATLEDSVMSKRLMSLSQLIEKHLKLGNPPEVKQLLMFMKNAMEAQKEKEVIRAEVGQLNIDSGQGSDRSQSLKKPKTL